jgi:hypothetical protein
MGVLTMATSPVEIAPTGHRSERHKKTPETCPGFLLLRGVVPEFRTIEVAQVGFTRPALTSAR